MIASRTPASENSGRTTGGRSAGLISDRRCSFLGGIDRARSVTVPRRGATCFVGSGEGMRWRRLGAPLGCVARAGVDVRARRTGVRVRLVLVVTRAVFFLATGRFLLAAVLFLCVALRFLLAAGRFLLAAVRFLPVGRRLDALRRFGFAAARRDVERTEPFVFLRDPAAFNCFPLFGLWPWPSSKDAQELPGLFLYQEILAEGLTADPIFFRRRSKIMDWASRSP